LSGAEAHVAPGARRGNGYSPALSGGALLLREIVCEACSDHRFGTHPRPTVSEEHARTAAEATPPRKSRATKCCARRKGYQRRWP